MGKYLHGKVKPLNGELSIYKLKELNFERFSLEFGKDIKEQLIAFAHFSPMYYWGGYGYVNWKVLEKYGVILYSHPLRIYNCTHYLSNRRKYFPTMYLNR